MNDKVVVITGAANGLGRALAKAFFQGGYQLALIDIDLAGLDEIKNALDTPRQLVTIHQADVGDEQRVISAKSDILAHHDHIDVVVNNAGISISQPFEQIHIEEYKKLFNTNFWGTVYCTKHFLPDLRKRKESRIVNVISGFAYVGFPGKSAYASSKSAIVGFTNTLKTELHQTHVKVCLVIPPPLETKLIHSGKHINEEKRAREARFIKKNARPLEKTANQILRKILIGKYLIIVGTNMYWLHVLARLFPTWIHRVIGARKNRFDFV